MKSSILLLLMLLLIACSTREYKIQDQFSNIDSNELLIDSLNQTALSLWKTDPKQGEEIAEISIRQAEKIGYLKGLAEAKRVCGVSKWSQAQYDSAFVFFTASRKIFESIQDSLGIANTLMNMGLVYDEQAKYDQALDHHKEALVVFRKLGNQQRIATTLNNIGAIYWWKKDLDATIEIYNQALEIRQEMGDTYGIAESLSNLGLAYKELEDYDQAVDYYLRSLEVSKYASDVQTIATQLNLGIIAKIRGNYTKANDYLTAALKASEIQGFDKWSARIYNNLSDLELKRKNMGKALEYFQKETQLDRKIFSVKSSTQIANLEAQLQIEERDHQMALQQKQIEVLQKDQRIKKIQTAILSIGGILIIIITLLFISQLRQRARLKELKLSNELNLKNKEISSYTLNFIQKNTLLEELKEHINEMKKKSDPQTFKELNKLNRIVTSSFKSDEEWENFRITFEQMHDTFFNALSESYGNLTSAEMKLCALLRLNMSLKEAASILGISPDSVKTARYRLRKKLGLKTEENLVEFLIKFEQKQLANVA